MKILFKIHYSNAGVVFDAIAVTESVKYKSKYNYIMFYCVVAEAFAPFISGAVIKDGENGINGNLNTFIKVFMYSYVVSSILFTSAPCT